MILFFFILCTFLFFSKCLQRTHITFRIEGKGKSKEKRSPFARIREGYKEEVKETCFPLCALWMSTENKGATVVSEWLLCQKLELAWETRSVFPHWCPRAIKVAGVMPQSELGALEAMDLCCLSTSSFRKGHLPVPVLWDCGHFGWRIPIRERKMWGKNHWRRVLPKAMTVYMHV